MQNNFNKKIVLGTVQMGLNYGINNKSGKISFQDSCKILERAFELGVNTLDTAEAYGNAHQVIGDFHKLNPHVKFRIITKVPYGVTGSEIQGKVKDYIKELNVASLEVLMFHSFDSYQNNKAVINELIDLQNVCIINKIGVSVYTNEQIELLLFDKAVSVIQLPFNLLDNASLRGDLLKKMKAVNKEIHTRSAFLQGLFFKTEYNDTISQQLANEIETIKNIVKEQNTNITSLALSYCLIQDNIDKVLIGVDSVDQLEENLKAASFELRGVAIDKIEAIKINNLDLLNPSLWE